MPHTTTTHNNNHTNRTAPQAGGPNHVVPYLKVQQVQNTPGVLPFPALPLVLLLVTPLQGPVVLANLCNRLTPWSRAAPPGGALSSPDSLLVAVT